MSTTPPTEGQSTSPRTAITFGPVQITNRFQRALAVTQRYKTVTSQRITPVTGAPTLARGAVGIDAGEPPDVLGWATPAHVPQLPCRYGRSQRPDRRDPCTRRHRGGVRPRA